MHGEPPAKWKADGLRLMLLPFKTYVLGVPLVLLIWRMYFIEPDPPRWGIFAESIHRHVIAGIFATVEYGFLACCAGLAIGAFLTRRIGDARAFHSACWHAGVALICLLLLYPFSQVVPTK